MSERDERPEFQALARLLARRAPEAGPRPFDESMLTKEPRQDLRPTMAGADEERKSPEHPAPAAGAPNTGAGKVVDITTGRRRRTLYVTGAAAALVLAVGLTWFLNRTPARGPVELSAVVLFAVGDVTSNGVAVKAGDIIPSGREIRTGGKSIVDLQVRDSAGVISVRLKQKTRYRLLGHREDGKLNVRSDLREGQGLFRVDRLTPREDVSVSTPTAIASVRGTRFSVRVDGDAVEVAVRDGRVAGRLSVAARYDLPADVIAESRVLRAVENQLARFEVELGKGESVVLRRRMLEEVLRAEPKLRAALETPEVALIRGSNRAERSDIIAAARMMDRAYPEPAGINQLKGKIRTILERAKAKKKTSSRAPAGKEYDELIQLNKKELANPAEMSARVAERNQARNKVLMKRIETLMGRGAETLLLKDGGKLRGVIITEKDRYIVLTPGGRRVLPADKVEGVNF